MQNIYNKFLILNLFRESTKENYCDNTVNVYLLAIYNSFSNLPVLKDIFMLFCNTDNYYYKENNLCNTHIFIR